jgi:Leucine-rich repeat (LRR) protein
MEIPDALAILTDLRTMGLFSNFLEGKLPSARGSLSLLTFLDLYDNPLLSGPISSEYGLLLNLRTL